MNSKNVSFTGRPGLLALLLKLGPVLLKILPKALKTIFSFKAGLAVASTALYSSVYHSWIIGGLLVLALGIHEYGHVWAMKRCGLKTKGMYLIPGFGALAIADDEWKSASNEAYIAIMGPIWGTLFFVIPSLVLYYLTDIVVFAGIAGLAAFINLLNLFPVNPLDGGRMMKTFVHSMHEKAGFFIMCAIGVAGCALSAVLGLSLIAFVAAIGLFELFKDYGISKMVPTTTRVLMFLLLTAATLLLTLSALASPSVFKIIVASVLNIALVVVLVNTILDHHGPWRMIRDKGKTFLSEWKTFSMDNIKRQDDYPPLSRAQLATFSVLFLGMAALLIICIFHAANVPGLNILKGVLE